ncbi:MAG: LCP family protein, partial [Isosphaeraceae bacterium]
MLGGSATGNATPRPSIAWSRVLRVVGLVVVILVLASVVRVGIAIHSVTPRTGAGDLLDLAFTPKPEAGSLAQKIQSNERINVLLMAYGGAGDDNPNFTDTVIVVSIRPGSRQATVISLPRNLWVRIPAPVVGEVEGKLYSAYALGAGQNDRFLQPRWLSPTGAGDLAAATVSETIGQPVDYWASIDSDAFVAVIDALGGVRVDVPETLDDPNYPIGDTGRVAHVHFDPGSQLLSGAQAVEYARSRLSTSEADRSRRQELVLLGMLQSMRNFHPGPGLALSIGTLESGLRTNLRLPEIRELAQLVATIHTDGVKGISLDDSGLLQPKTLGEAQILVPQTGDYRAVQ